MVERDECDGNLEKDVKMMNVLTIIFVVAGHNVERKLHFPSTEACLVAQRALNHSEDVPSEQPDEERIIYHCDFN
jgi:hypothetical protein